MSKTDYGNRRFESASIKFPHVSNDFSTDFLSGFDFKEESESPDTDNLSVDCDNLEEAKYVIQHMYNLCVAQVRKISQIGNFSTNFLLDFFVLGNKRCSERSQ